MLMMIMMVLATPANHDATAIPVTNSAFEGVHALSELDSPSRLSPNLMAGFSSFTAPLACQARRSRSSRRARFSGIIRFLRRPDPVFRHGKSSHGGDDVVGDDGVSRFLSPGTQRKSSVTSCTAVHLVDDVAR